MPKTKPCFHGNWEHARSISCEDAIKELEVLQANFAQKFPTHPPMNQWEASMTRDGIKERKGGLSC